MFAIIPFVPDFLELLVIFPAGVAYGYVKGRKRRRLTP